MNIFSDFSEETMDIVDQSYIIDWSIKFENDIINAYKAFQYDLEEVKNYNEEEWKESIYVMIEFKANSRIKLVKEVIPCEEYKKHLNTFIQGHAPITSFKQPELKPVIDSDNIFARLNKDWMESLFTSKKRKLIDEYMNKIITENPSLVISYVVYQTPNPLNQPCDQIDPIN